MSDVALFETYREMLLAKAMPDNRNAFEARIGDRTVYGLARTEHQFIQAVAAAHIRVERLTRRRLIEDIMAEWSMMAAEHDSLKS